ncbi:DUF4260 family protein [Nesterenkonia sp. PF2B19]|uniref:DUF4260 family protein n=1 Tax=Nesterenkonia sp. PF2B19 TaxID=1881858 RepID=UPI000A19E559|nr:DUF4260 family protein [Nesterenkonia sp. PF2B19]OSM43947.1 hypothetical protein BCY76_005225 [Nesterenkonia sp. PF2B19]
MSAESPQRRAFGWQRAENALIAVGIVLAVVAWSQPWWVLLLAFLAFDLSALGYVINQRVGAFCYNLVHNYTAPALLIAGWAALHLSGVNADWMVLLAACWGFHVAVDRALGFGLKLGPFTHTHLGSIGKTARAGMPRPGTGQ